MAVRYLWSFSGHGTIFKLVSIVFWRVWALINDRQMLFNYCLGDPSFLMRWYLFGLAFLTSPAKYGILCLYCMPQASHTKLIVSLIKWRSYERTNVQIIYLCRISQSAIQFWQRVSLSSQKAVVFGEKWPQTNAAFSSLNWTSFCMWKLILPHFFMDWHYFSFIDCAVHPIC